VDQTEIIDVGIKPAVRNISFHSSGYTTGMTEVATENSLSKQRLHYRHDGSCHRKFAFKAAATLQA
jgi:hypothetical protein